MYRVMSGRLQTPPARTLATAAVAAVLGSGLTACSGSAEPEVGEVSIEDLHEVQDDLAILEDRVGTLEGAELSTDGMSKDERADIIGQTVTVRGEVSELITTSEVGLVFRLAGKAVPSVAVLAFAPSHGPHADDVVEVSGTVQVLERDSFEDDFGIAEGDFFEDPDRFFSDAEGQVAISVTGVEIVQTSTGN